MPSVLILGSAPDAVRAKEWAPGQFDVIVAINNAWRIRPDWTYSIFPSDFSSEKHAITEVGQYLCSADDYVSVQNQFGGFVYAGGTMAFTAAYWALGELKPEHMFFLGCDMVYPKNQNTHFYGMGTPDPLRPDITLKNLSAKSARFAALAEREGCQVLNLSEEPESRLVFPRVTFEALFSRGALNLSGLEKPEYCGARVNKALSYERELGYFVESGKYWKYFDQFDSNKIDKLDALWLASRSS